MTNLLYQLKLPEDISRLSEEELIKLSEETRELILLTTLKNGGHLASNLGIVELTVAMLKVFDPLKDRILFDVGHQCYAYKILTDRRDKFSKLRLFGGISGFPNPHESVYDKLVAGHAGTALGEALGYSIADSLSGEKHNNITVIGDGAFSNGNHLEGFNNIKLFGKQIIIFNDNGYSISPSFGVYSDLFKSFRGHSGDKVDHDIFSSFGLDYIGCIDGNDVNKLVKALELAKECENSVIVHVLTQKGIGYALSEEDPVGKHSVGGEQGFSDAEGDCLYELMAGDERVVIITPAMGDGNGLNRIKKDFPNRFIDVGIAEGLSVSVACGLARGGYKPIIAVYSTFLQRAYDQLITEVSDLSIGIIASRAGIVSGDGETHQGVYLYPTLSPSDFLISYPSGEEEYKGILNWAVKQRKPYAIAIPKGYYSFKPLDYNYPNWEIYAEDNAKAVLLCVGAECLKNAFIAKELLSFSDIAIDIVNVRFPSIFDRRIVDFCKGKKVYTVEECKPINGFYSFISTYISVDHPFGVEPPITHGSLSELLFKHGLSSGEIYKKVKSDLCEEEDEA